MGTSTGTYIGNRRDLGCNCEPLRPWQRVQLHRPGSRAPGRLPRHGLSILPLWPQYALPALLAGPRVDIPMCRPRPLGGLPSKKRFGSHVRRVSGVLFGVLFGVSVRPLNACPPVGPEALQAWSLFQGTKAWLEPRLELTGTCRKLIPALCSSRSAVLARTSILRSERFPVFKIG